MNRNILIVVIVAIVLAAGGWWYFSQQAVPMVPQTSGTQVANDETASWKTFVNSRDGYSVKYPNEEIAGTPSTDCCSDLSDFGFNQSMSFMRYGGWADIYIFNGSIDQAITAYKKVDSENRVYGSTQNILIGGKNGKAVNWTNRLGSPSNVEQSYFVEYQPGKTLYIGGSQEFVSTVNFL